MFNICFNKKNNYFKFKMNNLFNPSKEAHDRNKILRINHNTTIPACSIWISNDIEQETKKERINWWSKYQNHHNNFIQNTAIFWIKVLDNNIYYDKPE